MNSQKDMRVAMDMEPQQQKEEILNDRVASLMQKQVSTSVLIDKLQEQANELGFVIQERKQDSSMKKIASISMNKKDIGFRKSKRILKINQRNGGIGVNYSESRSRNAHRKTAFLKTKNDSKEYQSKISSYHTMRLDGQIKSVKEKKYGNKQKFIRKNNGFQNDSKREKKIDKEQRYQQHDHEKEVMNFFRKDIWQILNIQIQEEVLRKFQKEEMSIEGSNMNNMQQSLNLLKKYLQKYQKNRSYEKLFEMLEGELYSGKDFIKNNNVQQSQNQQALNNDLVSSRFLKYLFFNKNSLYNRVEQIKSQNIKRVKIQNSSQQNKQSSNVNNINNDGGYSLMMISREDEKTQSLENSLLLCIPFENMNNQSLNPEQKKIILNFKNRENFIRSNTKMDLQQPFNEPFQSDIIGTLQRELIVELSKLRKMFDQKQQSSLYSSSTSSLKQKFSKQSQLVIIALSKCFNRIVSEFRKIFSEEVLSKIMMNFGPQVTFNEKKKYQMMPQSSPSVDKKIPTTHNVSIDKDLQEQSKRLKNQYKKCLIRKNLVLAFEEEVMSMAESESAQNDIFDLDLDMNSQYRIWNFYKYRSHVDKNVSLQLGQQQKQFNSQRSSNLAASNNYYHKQPQPQPLFYDPQYQPITSEKQYNSYIKRYFNFKSHIRPQLLTNCSVCFGPDRYELSNPIIKCSQCKGRFHRYCVSVGVGVGKDVKTNRNDCHSESNTYFQDSENSERLMLKGIICDRCRYKKMMKNVKEDKHIQKRQNIYSCFICETSEIHNSLMLHRISSKKYVHGFCMLMSDLWTVDNKSGEIKFTQQNGQSLQSNCNKRDTKQQQQPNHPSASASSFSQSSQLLDDHLYCFLSSIRRDQCKICHRQSWQRYLFECQQCHGNIHSLCAYLNGSRIECRNRNQKEYQSFHSSSSNTKSLKITCDQCLKRCHQNYERQFSSLEAPKQRELSPYPSQSNYSPSEIIAFNRKYQINYEQIVSKELSIFDQSKSPNDRNDYENHAQNDHLQENESIDQYFSHSSNGRSSDNMKINDEEE